MVEESEERGELEGKRRTSWGRAISMRGLGELMELGGVDGARGRMLGDQSEMSLGDPGTSKACKFMPLFGKFCNVKTTTRFRSAEELINTTAMEFMLKRKASMCAFRTDAFRFLDCFPLCLDSLCFCSSRLSI